MIAEVKSSVSVTLVLSEEEASWLRGVMQNPLYNVPLEEEDPVDNAMRRTFFTALSNKYNTPVGN